ncbi:hypothetical protein WJX73_007289 [Symbiochloris irregularis]|uniref:Uncharacterized protein n=1 Tax=Symbiochloris irregularis TaxID=706552 RepID=A0AAW1PZC3_9CHLO
MKKRNTLVQPSLNQGGNILAPAGSSARLLHAAGPPRGGLRAASGPLEALAGHPADCPGLLRSGSMLQVAPSWRASWTGKRCANRGCPLKLSKVPASRPACPPCS